ncbi:MAG: hypothetical protein H0X64_06290, partial [Gemmatimonadaceae bacterium]|nr:hypothetical protein [Gemmatimonadaceae bacterium]
MARRAPARWVVWEALSPPFGLAIVALGGAKLNGAWEGTTHFGLDPVLVIFGGLLEVIVGLCIFFGPTRLMAAVACSAWLTAVCARQLVSGFEGPMPLSGLIALGAIGIALYAWRHRTSRTFRFPQPLALPPSGAVGAVAFLLPIVGVSFLVRWAVGGTAFWLSLPLLAMGDLAQRGRLHDRTEVLRTILAYLLVLGIGVSSWWGFVGHYFMSDAVAASVGWDTGSP